MKSSDYIVDFLVKQGITECYGYQGTMIAHLVDSICNCDQLRNHCCYNEQGAAFAAVGEAKVTGKLAFAYATSGPGAVNLMSGIADAYYDSAPVLFITGQLNSYEYLSVNGIRQHGFQQCDVISMVKPVVKYCHKVEKIEELRYVLEEACYWATEGRPGPVLIDLPMDMQRQEIEPEKLKSFLSPEKNELVFEKASSALLKALKKAEKPVLILGNGISKDETVREKIREFIRILNIPVLSSILGRDILNYENPLNFGFLGAAYGHRYANLIVHKKADLIVALGCSLCKRQTGMKTENFAKNAEIIRIEIDSSEIERKVHNEELTYQMDCNNFILMMNEVLKTQKIKEYKEWLETCNEIKDKLEAFDKQCSQRLPNEIIEVIAQEAEADIVCADVGQHQMWTAQSYKLKEKQRMLFSGGHGAMGFSLPAAIGATCKTGKKAVVIVGDGSMQMNIQELQWVYREQLPITICVLNNSSLGLIQQQQDDIFESRYYGSVSNGGYLAPDFVEIAKAYKINSLRVHDVEELKEVIRGIDSTVPNLIEIVIDIASRAIPKTCFGEEMHNQKPYMPAKLLDELLNM